MAYYGSQPEQTKAQIRSTRGETIDLALPPTCLVGELRTFLIDEYNYDPNTRLLYNGLVADDTSYVCDYPFGSLMIATPADTQLPRPSSSQRQAPVSHPGPHQPQHRHPHQQNQRQRQQPQQQQQHQPQQQEQHHRQHHRQQHQPQHQQEQHHRQQQQQEQHQRQLPQQQQTLPEPGRMNGRPSPTVSTNADTVRKNKAAEPAETQTNAAAREISSAEAPQEVVKAKGMNTAPRHCRRSSSPHLRSMSTESSGSQGRPTKVEGLPVTAQSPPAPSPPTPAATNNGGLPAPGSGRAPSSTGQRCSPGPQSSQDAPAPPTQTPRPPPSPQSAAGEVPNSQCDNDVGRQRQQVQLTVECHIPSLNQVVPVVVSGESSVSDVVLALAAAVPALAPDAQVVYHGRTLPNSVHAKLFDYGIRSDTRVFIAAGEYRNTEKITLLEIEDDTSIIERATKSPMTDLQRKGYYEELMRILFRTDGLQSLEGEWRQRRKDAVRHITALQDALGVEGKVF